MPKREVKIRDGEVVFLNILFGSSSLDESIKEASKKGFNFDSLAIGSVQKEGPWVSTLESTIVSPLLYLSGKDGKKAILAKGANEQYVLFDYRSIP